MEGFLPYTTTGSETWALIAYRAYGDASLIKRLTDANPDVKIDAILPAGITLNIPVVPLPDSTIDNDQVPIWKKS